MRSNGTDGRRGRRAVAAMAMSDDLFELMQSVASDWLDLNDRQRQELGRTFRLTVNEQAQAMRVRRMHEESAEAIARIVGRPAPDVAAVRAHNAVYSWDAGGDRSAPSAYELARQGGAGDAGGTARPSIRLATRRALGQ